MFGGAEVVVDGEPVHLPDTMAYKGMMLTGVPEPRLHDRLHQRLVDAQGRPRRRVRRAGCCATCSDRGLGVAVPERDPDVEEAPFLDFGAGYVQRSIDELPKQGTRAPWRLAMNYAIDAVALRRGRVDDDAMRFVPAVARSAPEAERAAG